MDPDKQQKAPKVASHSFTLVDLLDFEAQLARDAAGEGETLRAREAGLRDRVLVKDHKMASLKQWLEALRHRGDDFWPGSTLKKTYDTFVFLTILLGLISGFGIIHALLLYDGTQPVNTIPILAVFAVLPIFLLLNYAFKALIYRLFKKLPGGAMLFLAAESARSWLEKRGQKRSRGAAAEAVARTFAQRLGALYPRLLQNHAWKLLQNFGMAAHGAALLTFIGLVAFNDYTFGWRTTLQLEPMQLYRMLEILAWPFMWVSEAALPSLEVIQASQFSRFERGYLQEGLDAGARSTAEWWPFLALVIATYGFLPRLLLWILLEISIRKELRLLAFDDFRSEALWRRLSEGQLAWASDGPVESGFKPSAESPLLDFSSPASRSCLVIRWRELPMTDEELTAFFQTRFRLTPLHIMDAQGLSQENEAMLRMFGKAEALVVASDPWELPGEAIEKMRQSLRANIGRTIAVLFAPLDRQDEGIRLAGDRGAWRHAIKAFRDPYLGLLEER